MTVEIVVPALGESVSEATIARWLKKPGEAVERDEPLVELETDKVSLEIPAPASGRLAEVVAPEGSDVAVGAVIGRIEEGAAEAAPAAREEAPEARGRPAAEPAGVGGAAAEAPAAAAPVAPAAPQARPGGEVRAGPAARRVAAEKGIDLAAVPPTGPRGVVTKADVLAFPQATAGAPAARAEPALPPGPAPLRGREERVRMTRLRKRIAERLKEAQNTAAMLTTFNECDMSAVMALRERYRDSFEKRHGVRLGFMSFFVKACIDALRAFPAVNAEIDGDEIVYKYYYHIGVAVSTDQGLVVPVLRDADAMSFAEIEKAIADLGRRAREGRISVEELTGGTFTITNGGVFGSLMSTPILNPPQVGILGMHKIQNRPVALGDGSIVVRPMMYLALSYDHRIIDGREAVSFLVRVKECIEQPERLMLEV